MKSLKIIALLLCVLLILPMLFACKKNDDGAEAPMSEALGDPEAEDALIPDFNLYAEAAVTVKLNGETEAEVYDVTADISVSGDNFRILSRRAGMVMSITFFDNVLYADIYGEKYKIDFNSFDLETIIGLIMMLPLSAVPEVDTEGIEMYTSSGKGMDIESLLAGAGSAMFKESETEIGDNGAETTVLTGVQPKIASLIDTLIMLVLKKQLKPNAAIAIDYDTFEVGMSNSDENAALAVSFGGVYTESEIVIAEFGVSVNVGGSVGNIVNQLYVVILLRLQ